MSLAPRPVILITNDDDITAKGIRILAEAMQALGEIVVIAPDRPQSGQGHAITISSPIRLRRSPRLFEGIEAYETTGTPADCVKLGKHLILRDKKPDLVVSGINHGSNAAISVLYSGTMSGAMEAAIEGIPAIGFSLDDFSPEADFSHTVPFVQQLARQVLASGLPPRVALNVNFPARMAEPPRGIRLCRQADARYLENFESRKDPHGRPYYWLDGDFVDFDRKQDTDIWALKNNFVSVVPCTTDLTAYGSFEALRSLMQAP